MLTMPFYLFQNIVNWEEFTLTVYYDILTALVRYCLAISAVSDGVDMIGTVGSPRVSASPGSSSKSRSRSRSRSKSPSSSKDLSVGFSDTTKILLNYIIDEGIKFKGPLNELESLKAAQLFKRSNVFEKISQADLSVLLQKISGLSGYQL
jgi:hypothetical protein